MEARLTRNNIVKVMHVVDTLDIGGTETVAVNLVNELPQTRYRAYLCTTRRDGPLEAAVAPHVQRLRLHRTRRFDLRAAFTLARFIEKERIDILHVHSSSLFLGRLASFLRLRKRPKLLWHDHYGRCEYSDRSAALYRLATLRIDGVIVVNEQLAAWSKSKLGIPSERVWYLPNFVLSHDKADNAPAELPGLPGSRIVCVANLRPQKDHITLLRAMKLLCGRRPDAHLIVIGGAVDAEYAAKLRREVSSEGLDDNVSFLGSIKGVPSYLRLCDIGVLTSRSEGLPLSLLEYGWAGLATVATRVGQCAEVLDNGKAGILVDCGSPEAVAEAIEQFLAAPEKRVNIGLQFREFVQKKYSPELILKNLCQVYEKLFTFPTSWRLHGVLSSNE